jgi:hypothetical protein
VSGRVFSLAVHQDAATGKAASDDVREHTASLSGSAALGAISSFGVDHDGELLVLNFSNGTIVGVVPDTALAPSAPQLLRRTESDRTVLEWRVIPEGVPVATFLLEVLRNGGVIVRRTVDGTAEGGSVALAAWSSGDCVRVRAVARTGISGPPSNAICGP